MNTFKKIMSLRVFAYSCAFTLVYNLNLQNAIFYLSWQDAWLGGYEKNFEGTRVDKKIYLPEGRISGPKQSFFILRGYIHGQFPILTRGGSKKGYWGH